MSGNLSKFWCSTEQAPGYLTNEAFVTQVRKVNEVLNASRNFVWAVDISTGGVSVVEDIDG